MDVSHPIKATKNTAVWIRKGDDKAIKTIGSRSRINLVAAVELGHLGNAVIKKYEKRRNRH